MVHILSAIGSLHDSYGNAPELLDAVDSQRLWIGAWSRASDEVICTTCSEPYWKHPKVLGALWLRRICGDHLVKL